MFKVPTLSTPGVVGVSLLILLGGLGALLRRHRAART
jgi:hypothetical protein